MLENTDFKGLEWLVVLSLICTVPVPRALLELVYLPWDVLMDVKGVNYHNRAQNNIGTVILSLFFLIPLLYKSFSNCRKRIKGGIVSAKQGWKEYVTLLFIYFFLLFAISSMMTLLWPPLMHFKRQLGPHDANPL